MIRVLPCAACQKPATLPNGEPYTLGRAPDAGGLTYKCCRCRRMNKISAEAYQRLPVLTVAEMDELGVLDMILRDLPGVDREQLKALQEAGVSLHELHPAADAR